MKKFIVIVVILLTIIAAFTAFTRQFRQHSQKEQPTARSVAEKIVGDEAIKNAANVYAAQKRAGVDFTNGPCLGIVAPDWVADIAHNPRQPVDDMPQNQCADFRAGRARHYIELDPDGKLIKMY